MYFLVFPFRMSTAVLQQPLATNLDLLLNLDSSQLGIASSAPSLDSEFSHCSVFKKEELQDGRDDEREQVRHVSKTITDQVTLANVWINVEVGPRGSYCLARDYPTHPSYLQAFYRPDFIMHSSEWTCFIDTHSHIHLNFFLNECFRSR